MPGKIKAGSKRAKAMNRRADGTFGPWKGGLKKSQLKKKQNTFQGIAVHIGKEFKRQSGRVAKVGALVRFKKADGTYHKQAEWYVRTKFGWRKSRTGQTRPTAGQVARVLETSRKGR